MPKRKPVLVIQIGTEEQLENCKEEVIALIKKMKSANKPESN